MSSIVDLTMPIGEHFRWKTERKLLEGNPLTEIFQITWLGMVVHSFTHVDSPRHIDPDGSTTSDMGLEKICGDAAVVDLSDVVEDTAIGADHLETAGQHVRFGDIAIIRTDWDRKQSYESPDYWSKSPYITRSACDWLLAREVRAVGYDFPQDYILRKVMAGETAEADDFVTHNVLLRNGVIMIEYLINVGDIVGERTNLYTLPLKLPGADGAPARVIAVNP